MITMQKEYYTLDEAGTELKMSRATLLSYMKTVGATTKKFPHDKRRYLSAAQVEQIKAYKRAPWKSEA